jgi:hypothetical protein
MTRARKSEKIATTAAEYAAVDFTANEERAAMSKDRRTKCYENALNAVGRGIPLADEIMVRDKAPVVDMFSKSSVAPPDEVWRQLLNLLQDAEDAAEMLHKMLAAAKLRLLIALSTLEHRAMN